MSIISSLKKKKSRERNRFVELFLILYKRMDKKAFRSGRPSNNVEYLVIVFCRVVFDKLFSDVYVVVLERLNSSYTYIYIYVKNRVFVYIYTRLTYIIYCISLKCWKYFTFCPVVVTVYRFYRDVNRILLRFPFFSSSIPPISIIIVIIITMNKIMIAMSGSFNV